MKMRMKILFVAAAVFGIAGVGARAETGVTNVINGVTNNVAGNYLLGNAGSFNALIVTNAGVLSVGLTSYVGISGTKPATVNTATVTGTGSLWQSTLLMIGVNPGGNNNDVIIARGGKAECYAIGVGGSYNDPLSLPVGCGNKLLVADTGSLIEVSSLYVGSAGSNNVLVVTNGGQIVSGYDTEIGEDQTGFGNLAVVSGAGSSLLCVSNSDLTVGNMGSGNRLVVADGGVVYSCNGVLGADSSSSGGGGNSVFITGTASTWTCTNMLIIGDYQGYDTSVFPGNILTVSNGASVHVTNGIYIGWFGSSNQVVIANGGQVYSGGNNCWIGETGFRGGHGNSMLVAGTGSVFSYPVELDVGNAGSSGNNLTVCDGGVANIWIWLYVGENASSNSMLIANGGQVTCDVGYIGDGTGAGNSALVTGSNSLWNLNPSLTLAGSGNNSLTVSNQGAVTCGTISIGSASNSMTIANNGTVSAGNVTLSSSGGILTISDGNLNCAYMNINAGAFVFNGGTLVTRGSAVNNGQMFIIGDSGGNADYVALGGTHTVRNDLCVGNSSSGNSLTITNGGVLTCTNGAVGNSSVALYNNAVVTGTGSVWNCGGNLSVGATGSVNSVTILAGARVINQQGRIGFGSVANSNIVTVSGSGSVWSNSSSVYVGYGGGGNQLVITNGGTVFMAGNAFVGNNTASSNNSLIVSGSGSTLNEANDVIVGSHGSGNTLVISHAGVVTNNNAYIGFLSAGNSNAATVTDTGSVWAISSTLTIGNGGANNQLTISNGGQVCDTAGLFSTSPGSSNNSVTVTGTGSLWCNSGSLTIGQVGPNNAVNILGGAAVAATNVTLGLQSGSTGNVLNVAGGSLYATNDTGSGSLEVRRGSLTLSSGSVIADRLILTNNAGALTFQLSNPTSNGTFAVGGIAQLGGPLTVTNLNGFQPAPWNSFTLLTAQTVNGTFTATNLPPLGAGLSWQLTYAPMSVVLRVVAAAGPLTALKFTANPVISGTSLTISATNTGADTIYLLTSTNVAAPRSTWKPIWTNVLTGNGSFTTNLSNAVNPALKQQFYLLGNTNN